LLPVQVSEPFLQKLFTLNEKAVLNVDLQTQTISIQATGETESFDINPYKKECLLNGYDDIDYLLSIKDDIIAFEKTTSL
jgi:3-isopropylmalate/(R)-2-methylmalate dehydratase small subunit